MTSLGLCVAAGAIRPAWLVVALSLARSDLRHYLPALVFAGFVATGLGLVLLQRRVASAVWQRRLVSVFLLYVVGASFTAGLGRLDLWPFSRWLMMTRPPPASVGPDLPHSWIYGVTPDGQEHPIDYRVWEPLNVSELMAWLDYRSSTLSEEQQRQIGARLLRQANAGREAALAGRNPGRFHRILGPLQAPSHLLFRGHWEDPADVPPQPFVGIRWYLQVWNIEARRAEPSRIELRLGFEYLE